MATVIPPEFNGDLFLWFNSIVGDLNQINSEFKFVKVYFPSFETGEKSKALISLQARISAASTSLAQISDEIGSE